jgi:hypothetical protein
MLHTILVGAMIVPGCDVATGAATAPCSAAKLAAVDSQVGAFFRYVGCA